MTRRIVFLAALLYCAAAAALEPCTRVEECLRGEVEALRDAAAPRIGSIEVAAASALAQFFAARGFRPAWSRERALELLRLIATAEAHGLTPRDYFPEQLRGRMSAGDLPSSPAQRAQLELLLGESLLRLVYHLRFGKLDPAKLDADWNFARSLGDFDAAAALKRALEQSSLAGFVQEATPDHPAYARLQQALARYRGIQTRGGWPQVPKGPTLKPGMREPRVAALRARLAAEGDLPDAVPAQAPDHFDEALRAAVLRFQARHGLQADGAVGAATLAALNLPVAARIDQLRVSLERARWVLHDLDPLFVVVNIAGFRLYVARGDEVVWHTRVVVGRPYRKTPVFRSRLTYLVLNPTWTVPPIILRNDVLPRLRRDPGYLRKQNMVVLDRDERPVPEAQIDWSQARAASFPYQLQQRPGPDNALGRIKFMLPNEHQVYLHDTPKRELFERADRTFSSGCIRVEDPFRLAELVMDDPADWNRERLEAATADGETRTVTLPHPVPVLLLYWTVEARADGTVAFYKDVYERDPTVLAGLNAEPSFASRRPVSPLRDSAIR